MSWFDTPDSWWDKDKLEQTDFISSYTLETWDLNRDNVPEEYHLPDRLRASFTIRVQGVPNEPVTLSFHVRSDEYSPTPVLDFGYMDLTEEMLEGYSVVGDFHEFICVDVEVPITYSEDLVYPVDFSLYPSYKHRLRVMAEAASQGFDFQMTEAEIHNIQFWSGSHSAFWQKYVNTYET